MMDQRIIIHPPPPPRSTPRSTVVDLRFKHHNPQASARHPCPSPHHPTLSSPLPHLDSNPPLPKIKSMGAIRRLLGNRRCRTIRSNYISRRSKSRPSKSRPSKKVPLDHQGEEQSLYKSIKKMMSLKLDTWRMIRTSGRGQK